MNNNKSKKGEEKQIQQEEPKTKETKTFMQEISKEIFKADKKLRKNERDVEEEKK